MTSDTLATRGLRVKALIEAYWKLRSYAVHDDRCKLNKPPRFSGPCSCGLTAAIKAGEKAADLAEVAEDGPTALAASPEVAKLIREAEARGAKNALRDFDKADWFWRTMDPDDNGDTPHEAVQRAMLGNFCVCEVASSFAGPTRYGFTAPVLDPECDDEEFVHFATHEEAMKAAKERSAALRGEKESK